MSSFQGTANLATDAVRSVYTTLGKKTSPGPRPVIQATSRVWRPSYGIVFGQSAHASAPNVPRSLSTIAAPGSEESLALSSQVDEIYVFAGAYEPSPNHPASSSGGASSGGHNDGSWAPSTDSLEARSVDENISQESEVILEDSSAREPIQSALEFHIPKQVFDLAKNAASETPESFWSYKLYTGPDEQKVKVHYCKSKETTERVLQTYFMDKQLLGFDIEWQKDANKLSGIRRNVSLIQLACEDRIALFHLALFAVKDKDNADEFVAPSLKRIMESPDVTKIGVSIKADCTRLRTFLDINVQGIFELSHLYRLVKYSASGDTSNINKRLVALATQVEDLLELPLYKGDSVRGSDWSLPLDIDQLSYAASDSYAGFMLYQALENKRKQLHPTPPRPFHADLNLPIRLASGVVIPAVDEGVDDSDAASSTVKIEQDNDHVRVPARCEVFPPREKSPLLITAESWAANYRAQHPISPAATSTRIPAFSPPSVLRTYALWHFNPNLSIPDIAAILRDPPLQESTVTNYILEAVRVEKLPADRERLRCVMERLPDSVREGGRYGRLWRSVGGVSEGEGRD